MQGAIQVLCFYLTHNDLGTMEVLGLRQAASHLPWQCGLREQAIQCMASLNSVR